MRHVERHLDKVCTDRRDTNECNAMQCNAMQYQERKEKGKKGYDVKTYLSCAQTKRCNFDGKEVPSFPSHMAWHGIHDAGSPCMLDPSICVPNMHLGCIRLMHGNVRLRGSRLKDSLNSTA